VHGAVVAPTLRAIGRVRGGSVALGHQYL
jgi:hypothetical protein